MSDSNRCQMYSLEETNWGVTPASPLVALRFTGESLKYSIKNEPSNEIRSDGQIVGHTILGASPGGGINGNLSYGTFENFMRSAMYSAAWTTAVAIAGTIACDGTQNALVSSTETMNTNVFAGQWVLLGAFSVGTYNDYALVTSATATHLVLAGGLTLATLAGEAATVSNNGLLRNGTTETSFTLERYHADVTQYFSYTGMIVNQMVIDAKANSRITVTMDFLGKAEVLAQATVGTGSATAANTNAEINAATNVANLLEGSTLADLATGFYTQAITLTFGKNVRERDGVGSVNNVDLGSGSFNATVALSPYFLSETWYDKYVANTLTGFSFRALDALGNGYIFTIHSGRVTTDSGPNAGSQNSDCMENFTISAERNATYNCMLQIDRFTA